MDNYWQLREFLDHFDPKLVMIETWGFNATRVVNYSPRIRVNQMRSLEAHCDGFDRYLLRSVPWLLTPKDWGAVGFQTIKNHQWIWTKPEVIRNNVANKGKNGVELNSLYLGRWVRFTSGMEASTLAGYPHLDKAPHDGIRRAKTSNLNLLAASWIKDLCDERGIKLLAFRAPMYHLHMKNDAYFHQYLDSIFHSKDIPFLDMQQDELLPYNPAYFENTLKASQHMTLLGSMKCAERLVPHINEMLGDCPRRFDDPKWRAMMSETNGFYRLNQAVQGDEDVAIIAEDLSGQGIHIEQAVVIGSRRDDADHSILQVVCDAWPKEANTSRAKTLWSYKDQSGAVQQAWVEMTADTLHSRPNRLVLNASIKQVEILKLNNLIWGQ